MQPSSIREAEEWLFRAERDLLVAERMLEGSPPISEAAAYHAQQAAEKAFKGFLAAHAKPVEKTHNLILVLTDCLTLDQDFTRFASTARTLSPYVFLYRYPGGPREPTIIQATDAVRLAIEVVAFVRERVASSHGGTSTAASQ